MSVEKIDYAAIIADLEAKRTAIENVITSLRTLVSLSSIGESNGVGITVTNPFAASGVGEIPDGVFHAKSIPEAIRLYLGLMRKKQSAREISEGLKKGGLESTSSHFDKIVYATLDRLRKAGDILKIEGNWGLPEWYPALTRGGASENGRNTKRKGRPRKTTSKKDARKLLPEPNKPTKDEGHHPAKLSERITALLKEHPKEDFTAKQLSERFGIHPQVIAMTMGTLIKRGRVSMPTPGAYRAPNLNA